MTTLPHEADTGRATARDRARWAIRDDRKLSKNAKLVWLVLDTRGNWPHPSLATLAADCRLSRSAVIRALRELEEAGWLVVNRATAKHGGSDVNSYRLVCPGGEGVVSDRHQGGAHQTPGGSLGDTRVVSGRHPKTKGKTNKKTNRESPSRPSLREQLAEAAGTEIGEREFEDFKDRLHANGARSPLLVVRSWLKREQREPGYAAERVAELREAIVDEREGKFPFGTGVNFVAFPTVPRDRRGNTQDDYDRTTPWEGRPDDELPPGDPWTGTDG